MRQDTALKRATAERPREWTRPGTTPPTTAEPTATIPVSVPASNVRSVSFFELIKGEYMDIKFVSSGAPGVSVSRNRGGNVKLDRKRARYPKNKLLPAMSDKTKSQPNTMHNMTVTKGRAFVSWTQLRSLRESPKLCCDLEMDEVAQKRRNSPTLAPPSIRDA